jgi:hypothetical protein
MRHVRNGGDSAGLQALFQRLGADHPLQPRLLREAHAQAVRFQQEELLAWMAPLLPSRAKP